MYMKKMFKNKKFIITIIIILILAVIGTTCTVLYLNSKKNNNDNTPKIEEKDKNKQKEDSEEFKVTFNPNGGSVVASITVKKGEKITKPKDPERNGYEFTGWKLNEEDFDFDKEITENVTLTANWKKVEDKSSTSSSSSSKKTTNYTSTIDKINLNENMTTSIDYENYTQPISYYFINNLGDVFPSLAGLQVGLMVKIMNILKLLILKLILL